MDRFRSVLAFVIASFTRHAQDCFIIEDVKVFDGDGYDMGIG